MRQPLMVTVSRIPPAQAEALYDASLDKNWSAADSSHGSPEATWPGEDWDDEGENAGTARTLRSLAPRVPSVSVRA